MFIRMRTWQVVGCDLGGKFQYREGKSHMFKVWAIGKMGARGSAVSLFKLLSQSGRSSNKYFGNTEKETIPFWVRSKPEDERKDFLR